MGTVLEYGPMVGINSGATRVSAPDSNVGPWPKGWDMIPGIWACQCRTVGSRFGYGPCIGPTVGINSGATRVSAPDSMWDCGPRVGIWALCWNIDPG